MDQFNKEAKSCMWPVQASGLKFLFQRKNKKCFLLKWANLWGLYTEFYNNKVWNINRYERPQWMMMNSMSQSNVDFEKVQTKLLFYFLEKLDKEMVQDLCDMISNNIMNNFTLGIKYQNNSQLKIYLCFLWITLHNSIC